MQISRANGGIGTSGGADGAPIGGSSSAERYGAKFVLRCPATMPHSAFLHGLVEGAGGAGDVDCGYQIATVVMDRTGDRISARLHAGVQGAAAAPMRQKRAAGPSIELISGTAALSREPGLTPRVVTAS